MSEEPQALANVLQAEDQSRGPDVEYRITVPRPWFSERRRIEVVPPRTLPCALCHGGGCDRCDRAGAVPLRDRDEPGTPVEFQLPEPDGRGREVCVRLFEEGGPSATGRRGHLLISVGVGEPTPGVGLAMGSEVPSLAEERRQLMVRSALMAAILIVTFVAMLKLSGWL